MHKEIDTGLLDVRCALIRRFKSPPDFASGVIVLNLVGFVGHHGGDHKFCSSVFIASGPSRTTNQRSSSTPHRNVFICFFHDVKFEPMKIGGELRTARPKFKDALDLLLGSS
ncbi:unnamed protein product [Linum trigynum]|uniref:Uncharacterized protein n=1 Tax=Linum trigynum TaxID=586398 RepID=A0AAV2E9R4_9ROSI